MRVFVLATLAALTIAACSPPADAPGAPEPSAGPAPVLAGVDLGQPLRVGGNEPFWAVEMTGPEMIYSGVDRPEQRAPQGEPRMQGTMAVWEATTTAGNPLKVTLTATDCSDGMSDRTYPLTAMVEVGGELLMGCAATKSATQSSGESGRVVDPPGAAQPAG
jgi:uncharacterized membrane protein